MTPSPLRFLRNWLMSLKRGIPHTLSSKGGYRDRICKPFRSPGIDTEESIPPAYVAWRAGTTNGVVVPALQAGNPFLGSLKGLQTQQYAS